MGARICDSKFLLSHFCCSPNTWRDCSNRCPHFLPVLCTSPYFLVHCYHPNPQHSHTSSLSIVMSTDATTSAALTVTSPTLPAPLTIVIDPTVLWGVLHLIAPQIMFPVLMGVIPPSTTPVAVNGRRDSSIKMIQT